MARKDNTDIHPNQEPTKRVNPRWQEKQARKFSVASTGFAIATIAFLVLLLLSVVTGQEVIFNIGIGIVFIVWFPCLIISATTAKYYDPWGIEEYLRENRTSNRSNL